MGGKNLVHRQIGFCLLGLRIVREFQLSYHLTVSKLFLLKPLLKSVEKNIVSSGSNLPSILLSIYLCNLSSVPVSFVGQS